jgi:hypothetical protein
MNANPSPPESQPLRTRTTPEQWDELRLTFHRSLMVDTSLASLAQNIDGCVWSEDGADEKPAAYVDLTYQEVLARLRARGLPPALIDDLVDILRGTLSFDESFGAMVEIAGKAEARTDPVQRNLERLGIPPDFPVELCCFTPGTVQFCAREDLVKLIDFLMFSRGASRQVIVGGEFRDLLNAIVHIDEFTIARLLPFRMKTSGLYLVESVGLLVRPLGIEERVMLARNPAGAPEELKHQVARRVEYFHDQAEHMRGLLKGGMAMPRIVVSLDDLSLESAVAALLGQHISPARVTEAVKPAKRSLLDRLFRRG